MCGIFGYASAEEKNAFEVIHRGLKRLEYRGYDSWGISLLQNNRIKTYKTTNDLDEKPKYTATIAKTGIGHTRWATHGGVTKPNAHPHFSSDGSFVLAQNGIVENFLDLKAFLEGEGYKFNTQTDTEVIVKLIEYYKKSAKSFEQALIKAFKKLKGRNTIIILTKKNSVLAIKNGSPLTVGVGDKEWIFSSDTLSFSDRTNRVIVLEDGQMVVFDGQNIKLTDLQTKKVIHKRPVELEFGQDKIDKEGFDHFMLKEIIEQKNAVLDATNYALKELKPVIKLIREGGQVFTMGAGTASFAAGQVAYFLRKQAGVNAVGLKSYEVGSYAGVFNKKSVLLSLSQSGETADSLEAIATAKKKGTKIVSLVNMMGSTMSRESDLEYYLRVGPEICVVSTKAFTGKVAWGYLLANSLAGNFKKTKEELRIVSKKLERFLKPEFFSQVEKISKTLVKKEHIFVLGRGQNYYIAQEGALKIKETSYKHAEAFSAGELKHGVIALIEKGMPVICIVSEDEEKNNMLNAISEVKARKGYVIGVAKKDNELFDKFIKTPNLRGLDCLANVIPFQLMGYYMGKLQGFNPDKPRNLAKSVTVK